MAIYNHLKFFDNQQDSLTALEKGLSEHFEEVSIEVKGCVAMFVAQTKK